MRNILRSRAWAAVVVGLSVAGALSGCESGTRPNVQEKTSVGRDPAAGESPTPPQGGAPTGPSDPVDKLGQGGGPSTSLGRVPGTFPAPNDSTPGSVGTEAHDAHTHDGAQKSPMKSTRH